jgi:hypothetical protein
MILVVLAASYGVTKRWVDARQSTRRDALEVRYIPSPRMATFSSIGYKLALGDLFWIEALNYFGGQLTNKKRDYRYLTSYLDVILKLDPLFVMFYDWAATSFIYNGLEITPESIDQSTHFINLGINNLHAVGRSDANILSKGGFNFALEKRDYAGGLDYFIKAGRAHAEQRDLLLVASSYAGLAGQFDLSAQLKLEFLGFIAFEALSRERLQYAISVVALPRSNEENNRMIRSMRLALEKDEDMKEILERRIESSQLFDSTNWDESDFLADRRLQNILQIDFKRNWMNPSLHMLLSL